IPFASGGVALRSARHGSGLPEGTRQRRIVPSDTAARSTFPSGVMASALAGKGTFRRLTFGPSSDLQSQTEYSSSLADANSPPLDATASAVTPSRCPRNVLTSSPSGRLHTRIGPSLPLPVSMDLLFGLNANATIE